MFYGFFTPGYSFSQAKITPIRHEKQQTVALRDTEKKTESVFSKVQNCLRLIYYSISASISRLNSALAFNIFEGKKLVTTHNAGKPEEAPLYVDLKKEPHRVPQETLSLLSKAGYEDGYSQDIQLSPPPVDQGKCTGGVALFLKHSLQENADTQEIAEKFQTGIPIEGVLHQALYHNLRYIGAFDCSLLELWDQLEKRNQSPAENKLFLEKNKLDFDPAKWRSIHILIAYLSYLETPLSANPLESVDTYIQKNFQAKPLDQAEKKALYHIVSRFQYGTFDDERLALGTMGLEIDSKTPNVVAPLETSPTSLLNRMETLEPGSYKLSFPVYDKRGQDRHIGHTIAFVVQNNGSTLFYDPNYSITEVKNRKKAVRKVFKHYTGYSPKGHNGIVRRIRNIVRGHANPPKDPAALDGFELLKIKISEK